MPFELAQLIVAVMVVVELNVQFLTLRIPHVVGHHLDGILDDRVAQKGQRSEAEYLI
ncbi:MAG: hypothetical protein U0105_14400 [Candidatus Obscuribacterales bacterium]